MKQLLVFAVALGLTVSSTSAHAFRNHLSYLDRTATSIVVDTATDPEGGDGGTVTPTDPSTDSGVDPSMKATPILF